MLLCQRKNKDISFFKFSYFALIIIFSVFYLLSFAFAQDLEGENVKLDEEYNEEVFTSAEVMAIADLEDGKIITGKDVDKIVEPASMSKLVTLLILFDKIANNELSLEDSFYVSAAAASKGGSKMFVRSGSYVKVNDLIQGIIVQSGNDACIVVAENIAGSEENFANLMNSYAGLVGLEYSNFTNATGWPDDNHVMSASDIVKLAYYIWHNFPQFRHYFSQKTFTYSGIEQLNRNPLIGELNGVKGLKTGHTEKSGYGVVILAEQGEQGRIVVVHGLKSLNERKMESLRLTKIAFNKFVKYKLFASGDVVVNVDLYMARQTSIPLGTNEDIVFYINKNKIKSLKSYVEYTNPIRPGIKKGDKVGNIFVEYSGGGKIFDLVALSDVDQPSFFDRIVISYNHLLKRFVNE